MYQKGTFGRSRPDKAPKKWHFEKILPVIFLASHPRLMKTLFCSIHFNTFAMVYLREVRRTLNDIKIIYFKKDTWVLSMILKFFEI